MPFLVDCLSKMAIMNAKIHQDKFILSHIMSSMLKSYDANFPMPTDNLRQHLRPSKEDMNESDMKIVGSMKCELQK